jgi:hypothetical protein
MVTTKTSDGTKLSAATQYELAELIIDILGETTAYETELEAGFTIEQAGESMANDPSAWLLANGWAVDEVDEENA